jgi:hypothetical protein
MQHNRRGPVVIDRTARLGELHDCDVQLTAEQRFDLGALTYCFHVLTGCEPTDDFLEKPLPKRQSRISCAEIFITRTVESLNVALRGSSDVMASTSNAAVAPRP